MRPDARSFLIGCALALAACEGDSASQPAARDTATRKSCDAFARCNEIGPGKMYETRASCEVDQRAKWEAAWPVAECQGKINQAALGTCYATIDAAECGKVADWLNIVDTCAKAKVCTGGSPDASGG